MSTVDGTPLDRIEAALGDALHDAPVPIVSGYVFGSHAEGRAHTESDLDVGILLPRDAATNDRGRFEARILLTSWLIGRLHRDDIDVVILNDAPPTLGRRIVPAPSDTRQERRWPRGPQARQSVRVGGRGPGSPVGRAPVGKGSRG